MWKEGIIGIPTKDGETIRAHFWAKVYDEPSEEYGINGGRISKLEIRFGEKKVVHYDRGWDIEPETEEANVALYIVLNDYN